MRKDFEQIEEQFWFIYGLCVCTTSIVMLMEENSSVIYHKRRENNGQKTEVNIVYCSQKFICFFLSKFDLV